jgi:hypothetical protein
MAYSGWRTHLGGLAAGIALLLVSVFLTFAGWHRLLATWVCNCGLVGIDVAVPLMWFFLHERLLYRERHRDDCRREHDIVHAYAVRFSGWW